MRRAGWDRQVGQWGEMGVLDGVSVGVGREGADWIGGDGMLRDVHVGVLFFTVFTNVRSWRSGSLGRWK